MPRGEGQRIRILYVLRMLWEQSDEIHPLTANQMKEGLAVLGIVCERKTIYTDLDVLSEFGIDIIRTKRGAYIGKRMFELPELKLLVDAVQASRFITGRKSEELIDKLSRLLSKEEGCQLKHPASVRASVKTRNEGIYYNVDAIQEGIHRNCKISFRYRNWNARKELVLRQKGKYYNISPWLLVWENEKYYMVGYEEISGKLKHFRVDKMQDIRVLEEVRHGREAFESVDASAYGVENFGMFQGNRERVTLLVEGEVVGVIIDRFGKDVWLHPLETGDCRAVIDIAVSNQFFGWITGLGGKVRIENPQWVKKEYENLLHSLLMNV